MQTLYDSELYVVVQFDMPPAVAGGTRGGYEIVDKSARREIFLSGDLAGRFRDSVQALIERQPSADEVEALVARYAGLAQQPLVLH